MRLEMKEWKLIDAKERFQFWYFPTNKSYKLATQLLACKFSLGMIPVGGSLAKPIVTTTSGSTHNANLNGVVPGSAEQIYK